MSVENVTVYRVTEGEVGATVQRLIRRGAKAVCTKKVGQKWAVWVVKATELKVPKA